jgi:hypothetical protein
VGGRGQGRRGPAGGTSHDEVRQSADLVGETYDFEYVPAEPAEVRLEVRKLFVEVLTTQLVHVTT